MRKRCCVEYEGTKAMLCECEYVMLYEYLDLFTGMNKIIIMQQVYLQ